MPRFNGVHGRGRGATITVASSTARNKSEYDRVCSGVALEDEAILLQAIADLNSVSGGILLLSEGTFYTVSGLSNSYDHIRILGQGGSEYGYYVGRGYGVTTILATADVNVFTFLGSSGAGNYLIGCSISDVLLKGSSKVGGKSGLKLQYVDVFHTTRLASEGSNYGVKISDSFAVGLDQCGIVLNGVGVYVDGGASNGHHWFTGGFVAHNDAEGVYINSVYSWRNRLTGIHCHNNGLGGVEGKGLRIVGSPNNVITGGVFTGDAKSDGITLDNSNWNSITGNVVQGNVGNGIQVYGSRDNIISGNVVMQNDSGNTASYDGIHVVNGGGKYAHRNIITNNRCADNDRYQIYIESGIGNQVRGNDCTAVEPDQLGTIVDTGTASIVRDNPGYIAAGETRTASGALVKTNTCTATTVSGTFTESPMALKPGVNTLHCTASGTLSVVIPTGSTAVATTGDAVVTDSPKSCPAGTTVITVTTGGGADDFTITVTPIVFAWHNPEAQDIMIKKIVVDVTTKGGTATSEIEVGIADDAVATNRGTEFFNALDADAAACVHDSLVAGGTSFGTQDRWVLCQDSASVTDGWVVGEIKTEIANSLVGTYYVEYTGK